jgi:hypothetical protein
MSLNSLQQRQASASVTTVAGKDENVRVSVRVRPLSDSELAKREAHIWDMVPGPYGRISMQSDWKDRFRKVATDYQFGIKDRPYIDNVFR